MRAHQSHIVSFRAHVESAKRSFRYFVENIMRFDFPDFHREWYQFMTHKKGRAVIMAPRGHGKSTFFQVFAVWAMIFPEQYAKLTGLRLERDLEKDKLHSVATLFDDMSEDSDVKGFYILQVSFSQDQADEWHASGDANFRKYLKIALRRLNLPIRIVRESAFITELSNGSILKSKALISGLRGKHPHLILCDDLLTDKQYVSPKLIEQLYFQTLVGMLTPGTRIAVVGTPLRHDDLLAKLLEKVEQGVYVGARYSALDENGNALWPKVRPKWYLEEQRIDQGEIRFAREYLCMPLSDEASIFPYSLLDACDMDTPAHHAEDGVVFIGVDLARGTDEKASWTVYVAIETFGRYSGSRRTSEEPGYAIIREVFRVPKTHNKNYSWKLKKLVEMAKRYEARKVVIETNQFQELWADLATDPRIVGDYRIPVIQSKTGIEKHDDKHGIPSLLPLFETNRLRFAVGNKIGREEMQILKDELAGWYYDPDKNKYLSVAPHTDTVMALLKAVEGWKESSKGFLFVSNLNL